MSGAPVYVVLGPGGQGRDVLDALLVSGRRVAGVFDDHVDPAMLDGVPLMGGLHGWKRHIDEGAAAARNDAGENSLLVACGPNRTRL